MSHDDFSNSAATLPPYHSKGTPGITTGSTGHDGVPAPSVPRASSSRYYPPRMTGTSVGFPTEET
jgi:hypothetical protein